MLDSLLLLLIICAAFILIIGGTGLLKKTVGCILAPFKAIFKAAVAFLFIALVLFFFIKQMSHGPLLHFPSPKPTHTLSPDGLFPPTPGPAYTPPLPGADWQKEQLRPGIWYTRNRHYKGNVDVHSLIMDLTSPRIQFKTMLGNNNGITRTTTGEMARRNGALAAVNGDYFGDPLIGPEGLTINKGTTININPQQPDWRGRSALALGETGGIGTHAKIGLWKNLSQLPGRREPWMYNAVGGGPAFLINGEFSYNHYGEDFEEKNLRKYEQTQVRRTVTALTKDGKTLILVVADGPLTAKDAALLAIDLKGYNALLLDSGGSSTFYIEGRGVLNSPSDGHERAVTDALGIFYGN